MTRLASPVAASAVPPATPGSDFARVYAEEFRFVWRCLRALGVPERWLDDAVQDVFLVVHRNLADFRGEARLRTWLYGIVRRVAAAHRRRASRRDRTEELDVEQPSTDSGPHELAAGAEATAFVRDFLARLDDKKRDVFVLALLEQLSVPEVAEALGIPLNTAYTRLRAVRLAFRAALERRAKGR